MSNYTTGRRPSAAACRCAPSSTTTPGASYPPASSPREGRRLYSGGKSEGAADRLLSALPGPWPGGHPPADGGRQLPAGDLPCCWSGGRRSCGRSWNQRRQQLDALNQLMAAGKQFPNLSPGDHRRHSLCHETGKTTSQAPPDPAADGPAHGLAADWHGAAVDLPAHLDPLRLLPALGAGPGGRTHRPVLPGHRLPLSPSVTRCSAPVWEFLFSAHTPAPGSSPVPTAATGGSVWRLPPWLTTKSDDKNARCNKLQRAFMSRIREQVPEIVLVNEVPGVGVPVLKQVFDLGDIVLPHLAVLRRGEGIGVGPRRCRHWKSSCCRSRSRQRSPGACRWKLHLAPPPGPECPGPTAAGSYSSPKRLDRVGTMSMAEQGVSTTTGSSMSPHQRIRVFRYREVSRSVSSTPVSSG